MARPQKEGLDYFSMDVEKDTKLKLIKGKFGLLGFGLYIELLQYIYRQGYYTVWDEDNMLLFLSETGLKEEETMVMLEFMLDKDLFNKTLFDKYKILTSRGIQKRYSEGTKKRKEVEVERDFWIVSGYSHIKLMDTFTELKEEETPVKVEFSTQSKVKESKVKESKVKESKEVVKQTKFAPPSLLEVESYISEKKYGVNPERFITYYESIGWMVGKNKMKNRKATISSRESRQNEEKKKRINTTDRNKDFNFLE